MKELEITVGLFVRIDDEDLDEGDVVNDVVTALERLTVHGAIVTSVEVDDWDVSR